MRKAVIIIVLVSILAHSEAQNSFEVATVTAGATHGDNKGGNGQSATGYANFTAKIPLMQENGDVYLIGLTSQYQQMQSSGTAWYAPQIITERRIGYGYSGIIAGYVHPLSDNVKLNLIGIPYISSDYKDISSEDLRADIIGMFAHRQSDALSFKYGILYFNSFSGHLFWPIFGMDWTAGQRSSFSLLIPQYLRYRYQLSQRADIGINLQNLLSCYRMSEQRQSVYLEQQIGQAAATAGIVLAEHFRIQASCGYSILRLADFHRKNDRYDYKLAFFANKKRSALSTGYHNGIVSELKISYIVPSK